MNVCKYAYSNIDMYADNAALLPVLLLLQTCMLRTYCDICITDVFDVYLGNAACCLLHVKTVFVMSGGWLHYVPPSNEMVSSAGLLANIERLGALWRNQRNSWTVEAREGGFR